MLQFLYEIILSFRFFLRRAGIYTKLIREQVPLDTIDFELIKEKPQLMAFAKAERAKQLAGVK